MPSPLFLRSFELSAFELHFFFFSPFNSSHFSFLQVNVPGDGKRAETTNEGNLNRAGTGGSVSSVASSSLDDKLGAESRRERPWVMRAGWGVEVFGDATRKSLLGFLGDLPGEEDAMGRAGGCPRSAGFAARPRPGCARALVKTLLLDRVGQEGHAQLRGAPPSPW